MISVIDNEVDDFMKVYFISQTLAGVWWNFKSAEVEEYDEVVVSLMDF